MRATAAAPGFSRPMELRIPDGVSAIRYCRFPGRASTVVPLFTIAPSRATSKSSAYSIPWPNVPDAVSTGLRSHSPLATSTARSTPDSGSELDGENALDWGAGSAAAGRTGTTDSAASVAARSFTSISVGARASASGSPVEASTTEAPSRPASSTVSSSSSPSAASSSDCSSAADTSIGRSTLLRGRRQGISSPRSSPAHRPRSARRPGRRPGPRGRRARSPDR